MKKIILVIVTLFTIGGITITSVCMPLDRIE